MSIYNHNNNDSNFRNNAVCTLMIFFVSVAVFKVLMQIHAAHFESLSQATYGVLEGKPHWIAYQNRLLGPFMVYLISKLGCSYLFAFKIFILLMVALQNFLLFFLLRKLHIPSRNALTLVAIYSFSFLLVQHRWFYAWDCIDAMVFTLFAYGVFQAKSIQYFVLLFCMGILNRETALFIALYIIIDAFHFEPIKYRLYLVSKIKLAIGGFLILFGIIYTKVIRDYLFISRPDNTPDTAHELIGNHILLISNLKSLFFYNLFSTDIINTVFILGTTGSMIHYIKLYTDAQIKALLVYYAIVANIIFFGFINETRMYIILLPFLIFFGESIIINTSAQKK